MKLLKYMIAAFLFAAVSIEISAKPVKMEHLYMFGFSASFKDSTLYITDIQDVQGAWIDTRTNFLIDRSEYSQQLRSWLTEKKQENNRVCLVVFATSKRDAEKKYAKLKKKYVGKKAAPYDIRYLADFKFKAIEMSSEEQ